MVADRDGVLFIHVLDFLRGWKGNFTNKGVEWVFALRHEADFYNLTALVKHCDIQVTRKLMNWCWETLPKLNLLRSASTVPGPQTQAEMTKLLPSCFVGNTDVSELSTDFFESITHSAMDLTSQSSRDGFRIYSACPTMYLQF